MVLFLDIRQGNANQAAIRGGHWLRV